MIKSLSQVTCGLTTLGYIYQCNYSYTPKGGVEVSLTFVNSAGQYSAPPLLPMHKVPINIGGTQFALYPVASKIRYAAGDRHIEVTFSDELFTLEHYYCVMPGRGCGYNVFRLGTQVDNRPDSAKLTTAIDKTAQQIKDFTQYPDYDHTLNDFLNVLRQRFPVVMTAVPDPLLLTRQSFEGTFREVLESWCGYYSFSYFLENGVINIVDPTKLVIYFPPQPVDAIEYEAEEDVRSTYGKTVFNWYQGDGGEYNLSQTNGNNGPAYVQEQTLFPAGYEFDLTQPTMDLNQVAAAQYGQEYWFLYNYYQGTTQTECGWTPIQVPLSSNLGQGNAALGTQTVVLNQDTFDGKYQAYAEYGQKVAGRWYLSNELIGDPASLQAFTWFNESNGQVISDFSKAQDQEIRIGFVTPPDSTLQIIPETVINQFFPGLNYIGNRMLYQNNAILNFTEVMDLSSIKGIIDATYQSIVSLGGSNLLDYSAAAAQYGTNAKFVTYNPNVAIPQEISLTFQQLPNVAAIIKPEFSTFPIKGIATSDYLSLKNAQSSPQTITILPSNAGPNIVGNTSVIKAIQNGAFTVYYDKYQDCASASTPDIYYGFRFDPHQVSVDNQIDVTFSKSAGNTYTINRNYAEITQLVHNPLLPELAVARAFTTKRVTYSLNYFQSVPVAFLTNGLVGLNLQVGSNGLTATYTYSNEMLEVPNLTNRFNQLEQKMRNSWIRTYRPKEVIT